MEVADNDQALTFKDIESNLRHIQVIVNRPVFACAKLGNGCWPCFTGKICGLLDLSVLMIALGQFKKTGKKLHAHPESMVPARSIEMLRHL